MDRMPTSSFSLINGKTLQQIASEILSMNTGLASSTAAIDDLPSSGSFCFHATYLRPYLVSCGDDRMRRVLQ